MSDSSSELSSPASSEAPAVTPADSAPATPVVAAEPTPADKPISPLDAVTKALEQPVKPGVDAAAPTAESRSPKGEPGSQEKPSEGAEPADLSAEELGRLSVKTQERIRWLAAQRVETSGKLETATREIETYRPKADNYDKLTNYLTQNGINADEANNSLEITRLVKSGKYTDALKALEPVYHELQRRAGEVLPADLQEEVKLGNVPHERALELSRARAAEAARVEHDKVAEGRQQTEAQETARRTHVSTVAKAADDWAKGKSASDPDWDKKTSEVTELVKLDILENGFPKSKEDAIQRSEKALEKVNARWKSLRGPPPEIRATVGSGRSSTRQEPAKSPMEAVNRALGV